MILTEGGTWYSASDVLNWLGCEHRTTLDALVGADAGLKAFLHEQRDAALLLLPDTPDATPFDTPAKKRGDQHEHAMLQRLRADGHDITEIARPDSMTAASLRQRARETADAMRAGDDVVFQAALVDEPWFGFADFLVRVDGVPSDLGSYSYEVRDTKLARHASASALIQMAHYGDMVQAIQGTAPPRLVIWLGTGEEFEWHYDDAAPYLREARRRFSEFLESSPITEAEPLLACSTCRWQNRCADVWGGQDLIHVHRLGGRQRALLRDSGINTITELAVATDTARPTGIGPATFQRLREQAQVQTGGDDHRLIRPQSRVDGLAGIPKPHRGDIYFDLEGDPFAAIPTLDYLWAYCDAKDAYHFRWAHTPSHERDAFRWFMQTLQGKDPRGDWHVYHYNTYERTSLRRIAEAWPDPAERAYWMVEVEQFIDDRFVDLYRGVEHGLRTRDGSTSLKIVEKLAGYDRSIGAAAGAVAKADDSIVAYETYLDSGDAQAKAAILQGILDYNTHDVRATHAVHRWLYERAQELTPDDFTHEPEEYVPSSEVFANALRTDDLSERLQADGAIAAPGPSCLSDEGRYLLAHMLRWHRDEQVVQYLDHLRLRSWALDEAEPDSGEQAADVPTVALDGAASRDTQTRITSGTEHESCLLDVAFVRRGPATSTHAKPTYPYEFTCRPGSWKVKAGSPIETARTDEDGRAQGFIASEIDPQEGTFTLTHREVPSDPGPLILRPFNGGTAVWEALMRLGEEVLLPIPDDDFAAGIDLIERVPPLDAAQMDPRPGEDAHDRARRLASAMTSGVLPVQGPPGTGKTYLGARLIGDAVTNRATDRPAVIAVTANSHRVIDNLLLEVQRYCSDAGIEASIGHAGKDDQVDAGIPRITANGEVPGWIAARRAEGRACVVGATKYAWCRQDLQGSADVLVIDEAGQLPLADALATTQVAPVIIALGDPQQLAAPIQAAHDESVEVSVLQHLAQGAAVLPPHVGVFLDRSHRMHGELCRVVADLAYDGVLQPSDEAARRNIAGPPIACAGVTVEVRPGVAWLPVQGGADDEVNAIIDVVRGLVGKATVTLEDGTRKKLKSSDVLVVAPHNAHVNRIRAALPDIEVGTVDRFQGQQEHVVIFSMGRLAQSPSDVPFLYEMNRINVALSRARLLAVVISHPDATFPPVAAPDQLLLASRFIRAVNPTP